MLKMYTGLKKTMDEELESKIKNEYGLCNSELEHEYLSKYFETGKRYYAKRNNFKVLFRNYIKVVGKFMILYKKIR